jgi:hypothetical protein
MGDIQDYIMPFITFILGGGLITFLKYRKEVADSDKKDRREFDAIERDKYKKMAEEQEKRISQLELLVINSNHPEWRKNSRGVYEYVSTSYEICILLPMGKRKEDAIGKSDEEIFQGYPKVWKTLKELDIEAALSPLKTAVKRGIKFPNNEDTMMVIKEIAQTIDDRTYYIGRAYRDELVHASTR